MALVRPEPSPWERILLYGQPKTSKTRLATSLPEEYFGDIVYFAADPGSESLSPVITEMRSRIHIVKSAPQSNLKHDPDADAFIFALNDWRKEFPKAKTIIWDTLTQTSYDILQFIADEGKFSEGQHVAIGSGPDRMNLPMPGDYLSAQERVDRLVTYLFRQPMHVICVCHADYDMPEKGSAVEAEGGPKTVGKATIRRFAGKFDGVIYTAVEHKPPAKFGDPSLPIYYAYTAKTKIWTAGIRGGNLENPIPRVQLNPFPINFWHLYLKHFRGIA